MAMKSNWLLKYGFPLLIIGIAVVGGIYQGWQHQHQHTPQIACPDPLKNCLFQLNRQAVHVEFLAPPSGLHPFILRVQLAHAQKINAHFTMRDMEMGYNQYRLLPLSPQLWQAKVVLPVCVTGRHDWILTLEIDDQKVEIPFTG
ncbi:MAG: hypothetical protein HOP20_02085 [Sulfuriferula sp.]|nr:hypothetical protein [Sulfuriferula sp.]